MYWLSLSEENKLVVSLKIKKNDDKLSIDKTTLLYAFKHCKCLQNIFNVNQIIALSTSFS